MLVAWYGTYLSVLTSASQVFLHDQDESVQVVGTSCNRLIGFRLVLDLEGWLVTDHIIDSMHRLYAI